MKYKLVAIDLDDTLLKDDLTISERVKKAIKASIDKGTLVTFATGRMYASALPYALDLNLDLPLITYQGALVKYADGREIYHRPLELSLAREVVEFLKPKNLHINVYLNDILCMEKITEEGKNYSALVGIPIHQIRFPDDITIPVTKIVLIGDKEELDPVEAEIEERFKDTINSTRSKPYFLEIAHPLATKGNALKKLANSLGIRREEVIAIGDSMNDYDMIEYAGFGVAMANGNEAVKNIADYITTSNEDDGVAEVFEKFVLKK